jgi:hypothetical protein
MSWFKKKATPLHGAPALRDPSPPRLGARPSNSNSMNVSTANILTRTDNSGRSSGTSIAASSRSAETSRGIPPPPYLNAEQQENLMKSAVKAYMVFYRKGCASDRTFAAELMSCAIRNQPQLEREIKGRIEAAIKQWNQRLQDQSVPAVRGVT